jgi:hypothetical protein
MEQEYPDSNINNLDIFNNEEYIGRLLSYKDYILNKDAYERLKYNNLTDHIQEIVYAGKIKNKVGFLNRYFGKATAISKTLKTNFNNCNISNTDKYYGYIISKNKHVVSLKEKCNQNNCRDILAKLKKGLDNFIAPLNYMGLIVGNIDNENIVLDENNHVYFTNYGNMSEHNDGYISDAWTSYQRFSNGKYTRFVDTNSLRRIIVSIIREYMNKYIKDESEQNANELSLELIKIYKDYNIISMSNPPPLPNEKTKTRIGQKQGETVTRYIY